VIAQFLRKYLAPPGMSSMLVIDTCTEQDGHGTIELEPGELGVR
jgi:hypothetical protein